MHAESISLNPPYTIGRTITDRRKVRWNTPASPGGCGVVHIVAPAERYRNTIGRGAVVQGRPAIYAGEWMSEGTRVNIYVGLWLHSEDRSVGRSAILGRRTRRNRTIDRSAAEGRGRYCFRWRVTESGWKLITRAEGTSPSEIKSSGLSS